MVRLLTIAIIYCVTMSGIPSVMSCYAEVREVKHCVYLGLLSLLPRKARVLVNLPASVSDMKYASMLGRR